MCGIVIVILIYRRHKYIGRFEVLMAVTSYSLVDIHDSYTVLRVNFIIIVCSTKYSG
jgi:hypothetical protein